jgi:hypothetical protein
MAKKENKAKEQTVSIDGVEYKVSDLLPTQIEMVNHVADLTNKEKSMAFNLAQIQGGRNYFMGSLKESLKNGKPESD